MTEGQILDPITRAVWKEQSTLGIFIERSYINESCWEGIAIHGVVFVSAAGMLS